MAIYGRRRVGKTFLTRHAFQNKGIYFEMTGIKKGSMHEQLVNFASAVSQAFLNGERCPIPKNWQAAFDMLRKHVNQASDQKVILFFDELPWMATPRSGCLRHLEHFWNRHISSQNNVILIVCGSAASWMIKKVIHNRAGLYGRLTRILHLQPFSLKETEAFLVDRDIHLDCKQIVELYMTIGGIPHYLNFLTKRVQSSAQMINELFFSKNAPLAEEFTGLFESLFDHHENHKKIVVTLHNKPHGLSKLEILKSVGLTSGGYSTQIFQELERSGFIGYIKPFGKKQLGGRYILIDELSFFYLNWLAPKSLGGEGAVEDYWLKMHNIR